MEIVREPSQKRNEEGMLEPVVDVRIPIEKPGLWVVWNLSDVHLDNSGCHRKLLKKHIGMIREDPKARVVIGGDFNDMIFHGDPRFQPSQLHGRFTDSDDAADAVVEMNVELLEPIKDKIDVYISGNHEEGFMKRHKTNVARRTAKELGVPYRSYFCLLCYYFEYKGQVRTSNGWLHHGFGSSSPVTKGMINLERVAAQNRFDWTLLGHIHQKTFSETTQFDRAGSFGYGGLIEKPVSGAICGTYLRNYPGGESASYSAQKGHSPARLGAGRMFLDVAFHPGRGIQIEPTTNPIPDPNR